MRERSRAHEAGSIEALPDSRKAKRWALRWLSDRTLAGRASQGAIRTPIEPARTRQPCKMVAKPCLGCGIRRLVNQVRRLFGRPVGGHLVNERQFKGTPLNAKSIILDVQVAVWGAKSSHSKPRSSQPGCARAPQARADAKLDRLSGPQARQDVRQFRY